MPADECGLSLGACDREPRQHHLKGHRGYLDVEGTRLWYEAAGEGPSVLLLHAGIADGRMWDGLFEPLAERHRVVRVDLRGYGRSPLPGGPFSYVEDVRAVLDRLALAPAALVGASFGGRIALELALAHPDRVSALALLAPALGGWSESEALERLDAEENQLLDAGDLDGAVELNLRAWVDGPGRGTDAVDAAVRARVGKMQRQAFETIVAAYERKPPPGPVGWPEPPAADRLAELRVPALVAVGDRDYDDFRAIADRLAAEVPGARLAVVEDAAHMLALERPDEVRRLLDELLAAAA